MIIYSLERDRRSYLCDNFMNHLNINSIEDIPFTLHNQYSSSFKVKDRRNIRYLEKEKSNTLVFNTMGVNMKAYEFIVNYIGNCNKNTIIGIISDKNLGARKIDNNGINSVFYSTRNNHI